ncbi:MAG TPA: hypothetical protein VHA71_11960, partial [Rhodanobacteraceae bacterium]|nr:hypothetical protein [Rhodanobacteraceae bacterium]
MATGSDKTTIVHPSGGPIATPMLQPYDLFPTRIWQARLPALRGYLDEWTAEVMRMRAASPKPAGRTNRQGWNSEDMAVLERPVFAALRENVRAACTGA